MKRFITVAVAAGLVAAAAVTGSAQDKPLRKVVFALTTQDISVGHAAHSSIPNALGYWKEEGLDVEVTGVEGSTAGIQQLASGNVHIISVGPEVVLISREKGVRVKAFYVQARETIFRVVVPADSSIQSPALLKDKTIGVPSMASGSVPFAKALAASAGLNPDRDVKLLAVGVGAPAALALQQKRVDALGIWDTLQASLENRGLQFRQITAPFVQDMIGQVIAGRDEYLAENGDIATRFARGIARATLFGLTNPEAAVRIHWKLYPQTKPQGVEEAKALQEAIHVFKSRFELQRVDHRPDKRYGAASATQWEKLKVIYKEQGLIQGTASASDLYTERLVDGINQFDHQAVVRQATEYK
jgi:NitT/TauT family transport system substrate-binding protein